MKDFEQRFIELSLHAGALRFGEFSLKSGRNSPYFFNAGAFCSGAQLAQLAACYADKLIDSGVEFDGLFGPAYKGIPLVAATAMALAERHGRDTPYTFNRKEAKAHGEGGMLVGAPLSGNIVIVDDVITAGTAVRETLGLLRALPGVAVSAVLVGLDRQERSPGEAGKQRSAVQALALEEQVIVHNIVGFEHLLDFLSKQHASDSASPKIIEAMKKYRKEYGA